MRHTGVRTVLVVVGALSLAACRGESAAPAPVTPQAVAGPSLPDDDAGRVIARAIAAAGGWATWQQHRDAQFLTTLAVSDAFGGVASETILLNRLPLHEGLKIRLDSVGAEDEVTFGLDGLEWWMLRNGRPLGEPAETMGMHFQAQSAVYWFQVPFVLAEVPGKLSYLGQYVEGNRRWEKVRVEYDGSVPTPADWLIFFFDARTGLLDRVLCHVTAEFLRHALWIGVWRDYRDVGGIKRERRRSFFPGDASGAIVGPLAAENVVEHVHFDTGLPRSLFTKPAAAVGASPAG